MKVVSAWKYFRLASATSVIAAGTSGLTLFFIFRLGVQFTSVEIVGCWALIQGVFLVTRVADVGVGSNITRLVALGQRDSHKIEIFRLGLSGLILSAIPIAVLGLSFVWPLVAYMNRRFGSIIPYHDILSLTFSAFIFAVVNSVSLLLMSIIEGLGKLAWRNGITITANVIIILIVYPIIHRFGSAGLGYSYVALSLIQFVLAGAVLCSQGSFILEQVDGVTLGSTIRSLWRDNLNISAVGLLRLTFEPVTKLLIANYSSLGTVAMFELALRVATQFRIICQSAIQPLLVIGSRDTHTMSKDQEQMFLHVNTVTTRVSVMLTEFQLLACPAIGFFGLRYFATQFALFFIILIFANAVNIIGIVGYYFQLSSGRFMPLVRIHFVMALANVILGLIFANAIGSIGAVVAYGVAFIYGGLASLWLLLKTQNVEIFHYVLDCCNFFTVVRLCIWTACALLSTEITNKIGNAPILAISIGGAGIVGLQLTRFIWTHLRHGAFPAVMESAQ